MEPSLPLHDVPPGLRPAARGLRLSSSFRPLTEAVADSGVSTPTEALLVKASDIIAHDINHRHDSRLVDAPVDDLASPLSTGHKLRSCLSPARHSDSAIPSALAARAAAHSSEQRGLHWKPELVATSAAGQRLESRELQVRYLKLEADLQESEAAKALLQKQLHRVQEAMKQNRDALEDAQRSAVAAEQKASAAEASAAALSVQVSTVLLQLAT